MKPVLAFSAALLLLCACETNERDGEALRAQATEDAKTVEDNVTRHSTRIANNTRDSIKRTSMKLREWWLTPLPEQVPRQVKTAYCYKVWQDITCYREPLPGKTHMLVAYQGDGAKAPPVAQTEALPQIRIEKQATSTTGEARVAAAKPVFGAIPEQPKADPAAQTIDATPAVGSEPLPDPSLSPQL